MKRVFFPVLVVLLLLAAGVSWFFSRPVVEGRLQPDVFQAMSVAPVETALTLARDRTGAVVLVTSLNEQGVRGVSLKADGGQPFADASAAFSAIGEARLVALANTQPDTYLDWEQLGLPLVSGAAHIAAGTNYRAHAEEVGLEEGPFLFPKLSPPTPFLSAVAAGARLDFEIELCLVPLSDYTPDSMPRLAYLLCGDYTDRWRLVKEIDLDGKLGVTGFPGAKGGPTRFPVGALLVIPRQDDFYQQIELNLYMNDELRQSASASNMIWSPMEILASALQECETDFLLGDEQITMNACDRIEAGTLVLTGTPAGVLFHVATIWNPWVYLRPGDVVTSFGTYLGYMQNTIEAPQLNW